VRHRGPVSRPPPRLRSARTARALDERSEHPGAPRARRDRVVRRAHEDPRAGRRRDVSSAAPMKNFRVDLILIDILDDPRLGSIWLMIALAVLLYVTFAPFITSTLIAISVLICTQLWWVPASHLAHRLRWVLLLILCIRGFLYLWRATAPT